MDQERDQQWNELVGKLKQKFGTLDEIRKKSTIIDFELSFDDPVDDDVGYFLLLVADAGVLVSYAFDHEKTEFVGQQLANRRNQNSQM